MVLTTAPVGERVGTSLRKCCASSIVEMTNPQCIKANLPGQSTTWNTFHTCVHMETWDWCSTEVGGLGVCQEFSP